MGQRGGQLRRASLQSRTLSITAAYPLHAGAFQGQLGIRVMVLWDCSTLRSDFSHPFLEPLHSWPAHQLCSLAGWPLQEAFTGLGQPGVMAGTGGETNKDRVWGFSAYISVLGPATAPHG